MANLITILRMIIAFIAICLLFYQTPASYIAAFILTIIAIWFDGLDGFVARLLKESSKFGAVLDILGDRVGSRTGLYSIWRNDNDENKSRSLPCSF